MVHVFEKSTEPFLRFSKQLKSKKHSNILVHEIVKKIRNQQDLHGSVKARSGIISINVILKNSVYLPVHLLLL